MQHMNDTRFAVLMALIIAASPFAIDAYLPAIPYMASYFSAGIDQVANTISLYILGMAFGQIVGGPMADRFGKRVMILAGLSVFALSSLMIALSEQLIYVQAFRLIQALGGGFAMVCVSPLIRERATGNAAAKLFSLVGLIMVAAPAIAPSVGALLINFFSWQSIFYFLCIYAVVVTFISMSAIPKDKPIKSASSISALQRYRNVLTNRSAIKYIFIQGCAFSVMIVFVTNASFIYQDYYQFSDQSFAVLFALNIIMMAIANRLNNYFLNRYSAETIMRFALGVQMLAVIAMFCMNVLEVAPGLMVVGIVFSVGAQGAIAPNCNAIYISQFNQDTGSASALIGSIQFFMAAVLGGVSTFFFDSSLWPVITVMLILAMLANVLAQRKLPVGMMQN
ncbi:Bcr/CflA family efflux MFS transporter [Alginatibacterium sediminis]|uniref:Bcr/CflA family efflux transporter n=1 Tax=Alginatibacterium sediminis TaxID=2164068 RepID=A0A420EG76_9ALTE|nr:multidrug effflux MFS transporter [Alginatibacterium sediminis]RKF19712.1 Bcr/CflA family efflux MFS transporter [Alginatibacterium sediminis]